MISVSTPILNRVIDTYGQFFERLCGIPASKCARDVLDEEKVHDQLALFCRVFGLTPVDLRGKRLLEIGSGFGIFVAVLRRDYGIDATGIEPASEGFDSSFSIAQDVMRDYGMDPSLIRNAQGELLPNPADSFDFIFSSTVLEHTNDPQLVLQEAVRVLKPNGAMQFIFPNYGSFFDGHYAIPWIPYQPHWLARLWVRLLGRDPSFVNTLQLTNYFKVRHWLRRRTDIDIVSYGAEIFRERMLAANIKDWAGLRRLRRIVELAHRLKLIKLITTVMVATKSFEPIILSLRKTAGRLSESRPTHGV